MSSDIEALRAIEDLFEKYLKEESAEKLLSLYYIVFDGYDTARKTIIEKFGSVKLYLQVSEDLSKAGIVEIPEEAKRLLSAREGELYQLLTKDARTVAERFDPFTQGIVALTLLKFRNTHELPRDVEELFYIYMLLTGEHVPEKVREVCLKNLFRAHLLKSYSSYRLEWSPPALYILKALEDIVPHIRIEFYRERKEEK